MNEWKAEHEALRDALDKEVQERDAKRHSELEANEYNGVLGSPPNWVPDAVLREFRNIRDLMLWKWGYTPEEAIKWVNKDPGYGVELKNLCDRISPNGRNVSYWSFQYVIHYLTELRVAVSLGPEEGLKKLSCDDAWLGLQRRKQLTEFGMKRGADKREEREKEWDKWRKEGHRILEINPLLASNKSELARRIKKNLKLTDAERTIRSRI